MSLASTWTCGPRTGTAKRSSPLEEADALFAAREAGATRARIRKATGLKPGDVTAALAAAKLSPDTRATVDALDHRADPRRARRPYRVR